MSITYLLLDRVKTIRYEININKTSALNATVDDFLL